MKLQIQLRYAENFAN